MSGKLPYNYCASYIIIATNLPSKTAGFIMVLHHTGMPNWASAKNNCSLHICWIKIQSIAALRNKVYQTCTATCTS